MFKELMALLFKFQFDKTVTSQIKKHDSYATYNSNHLGRIVTAYIRILFFGNYTVEDLLHHPHEMLGTLNPFVPNAPFLYSLKTSENLTVF